MFRFIEPNSQLKRYIKNYCIVENNISKDFISTERVFPNGNMCIVFHYGTPSKFRPRNSSEYIEPNLVICGQQTQYYDLSLSGRTGMILITFKPFGFSVFFNSSASELLDENVSLNSLIGKDADILQNRLLESKTNKQRIQHLEYFLLERLALKRDFDRVYNAIRLIENSKGQINTQKLSQEICLGIKQFERIFSSYVGINPKKYASIIRFQNVLQMKKEFRKINMYQLAFDNGYFDQSHFIHDFKSITGLSPRAFFNAK